MLLPFSRTRFDEFGRNGSALRAYDAEQAARRLAPPDHGRVLLAFLAARDTDARRPCALWPVLLGAASAQNALHVPAYAALAWSWCWALGAWLPVPVARAFAACSIASAYGVFDEWHQSFVPGRYASLTDVILNVAGAVLGIWLAAWIGSRTRTIKPQINTDTHG